MSTPIEIVRAHIDARVVTWGTQADVDLDCALASVLRDAERFKALELAQDTGEIEVCWVDLMKDEPIGTLAELADRLREGAK